jgi:S1-C subfamily serine protease
VSLTPSLLGSGKSRGLGSGVVIDENGFILTNNHVVAGAYKVRIKFNDGVHGVMEGDVVGTDPPHDIAVIKVRADDLKPITVGSSDGLQLGDTVIAIGYPLGLGGPTVTKGIVSGRGRTVNIRKEQGGVEHLTDLIQTDAAINPGNSGGPLVDQAGRLIGINTAAAGAATAENIGFAIAIDQALPIAQDILSSPPSERAWLGVQIATVEDAAEAVQLGLPPDTTGTVVLGVIPESPAAEAGLAPGDVIVSLDGRRITRDDDVTEALTHRSPGDTVELGYLHDGDRRKASIELARRPQSFPTPGG